MIVPVLALGSGGVSTAVYGWLALAVLILARSKLNCGEGASVGQNIGILLTRSTSVIQSSLSAAVRDVRFRIDIGEEVVSVVI
jgi:hypothetical protein